MGLCYSCDTCETDVLGSPHYHGSSGSHCNDRRKTNYENDCCNPTDCYNSTDCCNPKYDVEQSNYGYYYPPFNSSKSAYEYDSTTRPPPYNPYSSGNFS